MVVCPWQAGGGAWMCRMFVQHSLGVNCVLEQSLIVVASVPPPPPPPPGFLCACMSEFGVSLAS